MIVLLLNFVTLRANGVSLGSKSGRVGGVLFPYVLDLKYQVGEGGEYLPMAIFGILAIGKSPYHTLRVNILTLVTLLLICSFSLILNAD